MREPKSCREAEAKISQTLKDEKLSVMRNFLWNDKVSDEEANVAIENFNKSWINGGGTFGGCIVKRGQK